MTAYLIFLLTTALIFALTQRRENSEFGDVLKTTRDFEKAREQVKRNRCTHQP